MNSIERQEKKDFYRGIKEGLKLATKIIQGTPNKIEAIKYIQNHYDYIIKQHQSMKI